MVMLGVGACCTIGQCDKDRNDAILAQLPQTPSITLSVKDQPLVYVLDTMSDTTGIQVTVKDEWLAGFPVTACLTNSTLEQGLRQLLGDLVYTVECKRDKSRITKLVIRAKIPGSEIDGSNQKE